MAVIHKKETAQVTTSPTIKGLPILLLAIVVILGLAITKHFIMVFCAYPIFALWYKHVVKNASISYQGSQGESKALSELKNKLSDDYHIFVSVKVHEKMETDFVITGPNGVFVVEIKNYTGKIEGGMSDKEWTLHKTGRNGGEYTKTMASPLRQLRRNMYILSRYLKIQKTPAWLEGHVFFVNKNEWYGLVPDKCFTDADILAFAITSYTPRRRLTAAQLKGVNASLEKCIYSPAMAKADFEAKAAAFAN